jgi:hypothetical protein
MRKEFAAKPALPPARRGKKPKVLPRVLKEMEADVAEGRLTLDQLCKLKLKEVAARYNTKMTSARDAWVLFLKSHSN